MWLLERLSFTIVPQLPCPGGCRTTRSISVRGGGCGGATLQGLRMKRLCHRFSFTINTLKLAPSALPGCCRTVEEHGQRRTWGMTSAF